MVDKEQKRQTEAVVSFMLIFAISVCFSFGYAWWKGNKDIDNVDGDVKVEDVRKEG